MNIRLVSEYIGGLLDSNEIDSIVRSRPKEFIDTVMVEVDDSDIAPYQQTISIDKFLNKEAITDFESYLEKYGFNEVLETFFYNEIDANAFFHVIYSHRYTEEMTKLVFYCTTGGLNYFDIDGLSIPEYTKMVLKNKYHIDIDNIPEDTNEGNVAIVEDIETFGLDITKPLSYVPMYIYFLQVDYKSRETYYNKLWLYTASIISCGHSFEFNNKSIISLISNTTIKWKTDPTILQGLTYILCKYVYVASMVITHDMVGLIIGAIKSYAYDRKHKMTIDDFKNLGSAILNTAERFEAANYSNKLRYIDDIMCKLEPFYFGKTEFIFTDYVVSKNIKNMMNMIVLKLNGDYNLIKSVVSKFAKDIKPFNSVLGSNNLGNNLLKELESRKYDTNSCVDHCLELYTEKYGISENTLDGIDAIINCLPTKVLQKKYRSKFNIDAMMPILSTKISI